MLLEKNPNDTETQNRLNEIQANIDINHAAMNDLSLKKIQANFDAATYESANKKHKKALTKITKVPKESLN